MAFIPYSNDKASRVAITVDKLGRIQLSAALRKRIGCESTAVDLYLFFDPEKRRIGLAKEYPGKLRTFRFDRLRAYADARNFLDDNDIEYRLGSVRYYYERTENGIMSFRANRDYNEGGITFRQDPNGFLERIPS